MAEAAVQIHFLRFSFPVNEPPSEHKTFIQRVPAGLRDIGKGDAYYYVPRVVAIGPYHHGSLNLQDMEKVKATAAEQFCQVSGLDPAEVYQKIKSVGTEARGCYADTFEKFNDDEFTTMMLIDGCFLLHFITSYMREDDSLLKSRLDSVLRDIMLLENQLPWVVLEQLMTFSQETTHAGHHEGQEAARGPQLKSVDQFVAKLAESFGVRKAIPSRNSSMGDDKPPHLLGLFRLRQLGPMAKQKLDIHTMPMSTFSTAVELAEIGVKLTARKNAQFGNMSINVGRFFGELSLAPVFLNDLTACWLVNMAAYEACAVAWFGDYGVSSYLSLLALLMNRDEDVHELRVRRIVHSTFNDQHTLDFFKGLAPHLHFGRRYKRIFDDLDYYQEKRWLCIGIHKFIWNNYKTILTVFSVIGVLVPILKALLSLKQPQR